LNRFNGPGRGAWYAALELATCVAEVAFHIERELASISDFHATIDYAEIFASFIGNFVDVRRARPRPAFLDPNPAKGYQAGNLFADSVRAAGHYGIVYQSLHHAVRRLPGRIGAPCGSISAARRGHATEMDWKERARYLAAGAVIIRQDQLKLL
jgi:hypothetical protein